MSTTDEHSAKSRRDYIIRPVLIADSTHTLTTY